MKKIIKSELGTTIMNRDVFHIIHLGCEHGTWNMEHGTWNMEHGTWNMEHGTWNMEHGT
jgi:hypothetical protein